MLTITLNAALDVTYRVSELRAGASHAVSSVHAQAGGKGINVARVLAELGHEVAVSGLVAGGVGRQIADDLAEAGLTDRLVTVKGESRRTTTVVDDRSATVFSESGDQLRFAWSEVEDSLVELIEAGEVVIASGSLPPAAPTDAYARLVAATHARSGLIIVDTTGEALLRAAAAGADLVKPNSDELTATTGHTDPVAGARDLIARGARTVAVSLGPDGMLIVTERDSVRCRPGSVVEGNPTGAGDAAVAALALGLRDGAPLGETARHAVALSAAAVAHPVAGRVDLDLYRHFLTTVTVDD